MLADKTEFLTDPLKLFAQNRLVRDQEDFVKKAAVGSAVGAGLFLLLGLMGVSIWFSIPISAFVAGAVQPYLFRDIKFH